MSYRRQAGQNRDAAGAEVVNLRAVDSGSPSHE
jgi:hypothetical protein